MPLVIYQGQQPECIEGFPDDTERSCEGALHLLSRRPKEITDDEYAYIKANREDVGRKLVKVRDTLKKSVKEVAPVKKADLAKKAAPAKEAAPAKKTDPAKEAAPDQKASDKK